MTEAEYCSQVCGAQCCHTRAPVIAPLRCPKLGSDNLCTIFATRLGFRYQTLTDRGDVRTSVCSMLARVLPQLSDAVKAQCCVIHPELLEV
jgi:hypothetical protein